MALRTGRITERHNNKATNQLQIVKSNIKGMLHMTLSREYQTGGTKF